MKKESGKGIIKALILFIVVVTIIVWICMSIENNIKTQKDDNIVSNMMLIKGKCKVFNENRIRNNQEESTLIGTKLSDIGDTEEKNEEGEDVSNQEEINNNMIDEKIIEELKSKQVISEEEYQKYYVLTDANLEELKVDVKNEKNAYYLINYEMNEVIITNGYEGKYKLSEIEEARANTESKGEEKEDNKENIQENHEENKEGSEETHEEEKQEGE